MVVVFDLHRLEFPVFGLVQDLQRIRNQEANVAKLNDSLLQLKRYSKPVGLVADCR